MKITEAQLRQIIREEFSKADPKKRKEIYEAIDQTNKTLEDVAREMPDMFKQLDELSHQLEGKVAKAYYDREVLRSQVLMTYLKLDKIQKALKVNE